jgi:hypothetical protein
MQDPNFVEIGRPEIISRRTSRKVNQPPGGVLADYVPFYFNSRTPMLMNIKSGWQGLRQQSMSDIAILFASLVEIDQNREVIFSDRNATLELADFSNDMSDLSNLPWELWQNNDFKRDDARPDKLERYMAEALIHESLPASELKAIIAYSETRRLEIEQWVAESGLSLPVLCRNGWYC